MSLRLELATLFLIFLSSAASGLAAPAVTIVAHRGASYDAPENTIAAARLGWKQGADAVELDIHLTKDGQLAVMHDFNAKRTAGRDVAIAEATFAELRQLDAGSWKDSKFTGEKIPNLDEFIATIPAGKRLFVEIKTGPEIIPALEAALKRTNAGPDRITLISFNYDSLRVAKERMPQYASYWLVSYRSPEAAAKAAKAAKPGDANAKAPAPASPPFEELVAKIRAAKIDGLDLQHTWPVTPDQAKKLKADGLQLHVWTVDDPAIAKRWMALGVDSITTNRPQWLREQLAQ
jgi:glycerophosphoryl diester phosphodiesterase